MDQPSHCGRGGVLTFSDLEPVSGFEPLTCRLQDFGNAKLAARAS